MTNPDSLCAKVTRVQRAIDAANQQMQDGTPREAHEAGVAAIARKQARAELLAHIAENLKVMDDINSILAYLEKSVGRSRCRALVIEKLEDALLRLDHETGTPE